MKPHHTSGPWHACGVTIPRENPKVGIIGIQTDKGDALAFDWDGSLKTKREAEANALLIEFAPELLTALQNAYWHLSRVKSLLIPPSAYPQEVMENISKLIEKAGGSVNEYEE